MPKTSTTHTARKASRKSASHTRREFLRYGAAVAAGAAFWRAGRAHAQHGLAGTDPGFEKVRVDETAFPFAVAAGDVTDKGVTIWTRYDGERRLRLVVWEQDSHGRRPVVLHDAPMGAKGLLHVPVEGLRAGTEHRYAFYELERGKPVRRTRTGRVKTALAPDALAPVVVGASACTRQGWSFAPLTAAGQHDDFDVFIHLGDTTYCDGARSLSDFRERWRQNMSTEAYKSVRSQNSVLATWDDHEVTNDWLPDDTDEALIARARQAFFEHQPLARDPANPDRIWKSRRWGRTLEIFVLDSRSERSRTAKVPRYLGPEQMKWLKDGLRKSPAKFKLIANSVPIGKFPPVFGMNRSERWEYYPEARDEILGFIDGHNIPGVLWLSGDFHMASVGRVSPEGFGWNALEVLAGPGGQFPNLRTAFCRGAQWDWASGQNNYATLAFDPASGDVTVEHRGGRDEIIQRSVHRIA
jgi:alkaline phosphatase D